jgi:toxin YoeB
VREIRFEKNAFEDYCQWTLINPKVVAKIAELLDDIEQTPFRGKGKPEPLKHHYKGYWSRRITKEHRLIYKVNNKTIFIAKCRGHY